MASGLESAEMFSARARQLGVPQDTIGLLNDSTSQLWVVMLSAAVSNQETRTNHPGLQHCLLFPLGLPTLVGSDLQRVQSANLIISFCSAGNPWNAYMWQIPSWSLLLTNSQFEIVDHQVCMLGGTRDKWSRWLASKGLLTSLRLVSENSHKHEP